MNIDRLVAYCEENLGDPDLWHTPDGYPGSLALCIIDALYSTGSHYTSVVNVINRYRRKYPEENHGPQDLLESMRVVGGARAWAEDVVENVKPAHTGRNARLKAEVIEQAAELMCERSIATVADFRGAVARDLYDNDVRTGWLGLPSQSSGVTYNYMLLLVGLPSIKPDRMVLRFLADALGEDADLSEKQAVELLERTAERMNVDAGALDHIVWRAASGRELTVEGERRS
ncbi:MAG: hypothetical protein Q4G50_07935 [Corynebacterium sp.]|uniref:hypothetical protein n=1 Tax=Corynebacterium sp. TaxID=1720 RepID=UPI0026DED803|nr:hypothetical protein [Corynebacterium sp.]MDO5669918.1 hypothetical protein [Corynebacterium sp.]